MGKRDGVGTIGRFDSGVCPGIVNKAKHGVQIGDDFVVDLEKFFVPIWSVRRSPGKTRIVPRVVVARESCPAKFCALAVIHRELISREKGAVPVTGS